jgi:hypothetical protein
MITKTISDKGGLEELVVPTLPAYKRDFVKTVGNYLCNGFLASLYTSIGFDHFNFEKIVICSNSVKLWNDRKISSYGIKILDHTSSFLEKEVNARSLDAAEKTLSKGIEKLSSYEICNITIGARHDLKGIVDVPFLGGLSPMEGKLEEEKPSGYAQFSLSKTDRTEYLNSLGQTLFESYDNLRNGFKSSKNDKQFQILMNSLLSKEEINFAHVSIINDYMKSVRRDASLVKRLSDYFEKSKLNGLHKLGEHEKIDVLKKAGFKFISQSTEKVVPYSTHIAVGGFFGGLSVAMLGLAYVNPYIMGTGMGIAIGSFGTGMIITGSEKVINYDKSTLRKIERMPHE